MRLRHARIELELHELSTREGPALLLLHALGGSSVDWSEAPALWPGRVYALDFCGHGRSQWSKGAIYAPEQLAGDADVALAHIGPASIAGAGLGAYVALLLAGGRPDQVKSALLLPGRGLDGGGPAPNFERELLQSFTPSQCPPLPEGCDPHCCLLWFDPRPPSYVARFAAAAQRLLLLEDGCERPPWWSEARKAKAAETVEGDLRRALALL